MGLRDVWVELGHGSLLRADAIQKVEAAHGEALRVKVSGERTERFLDLSVRSACPKEWSEESITGFHESLDAVDLGRGLIDAIAAGAAAKGSCEIALRIDLEAARASWVRRPTGVGEEPSGLSFWIGFPYDYNDEDEDGIDPDSVEPLALLD
jgi:hypothetical protein